MRNEEDGLVSISDEVDEASFKQLSADMHVDGRQRLVHQVDVSITVHRPCQANTLLLTSTQVQPTLSDLPSNALLF